MDWSIKSKAVPLFRGLTKQLGCSQFITIITSIFLIFARVLSLRRQGTLKHHNINTAAKYNRITNCNFHLFGQQVYVLSTKINTLFDGSMTWFHEVRICKVQKYATQFAFLFPVSKGGNLCAKFGSIEWMIFCEQTKGKSFWQLIFQGYVAWVCEPWCGIDLRCSQMLKGKLHCRNEICWLLYQHWQCEENEIVVIDLVCLCSLRISAAEMAKPCILNDDKLYVEMLFLHFCWQCPRTFGINLPVLLFVVHAHASTCRILNPTFSASSSLPFHIHCDFFWVGYNFISGSPDYSASLRILPRLPVNNSHSLTCHDVYRISYVPPFNGGWCWISKSP